MFKAQYASNILNNYLCCAYTSFYSFCILLFGKHILQGNSNGYPNILN